MPLVSWRDLGRGLAGAAERALPVNMGLYVGALSGNRAPVTERDFGPEDIGALRAAAADSIAKHNERLEGMRQVWAAAQKSARSGEWLGSHFDKNGNRRDVTPKEYLADQRKFLADAEKPPTIQYENYSQRNIDALDDRGWAHAAVESFRDPEWRAMTAVGRARLEQDKQGNTQVVDTYDFNTNEHRRNPLQDLLSPSTLRHPTRMLDAIGAVIAPDTARQPRQVRINLGMVKPKRRDD